MSVTHKHATRYQQVRLILNTAARGSHADYGGLGRFWDHGVDALKSASLYGIAMIAPEAPRTCCGHGGGASDCQRSADSGLVQGLRGVAPFDGGRFPPLPWGGKRVDEEDIQAIADWIDAGCPEDEQPTAAESIPLQLEAEGTTHIPVRDNTEFGLAPAGAWRPTRPGELKQRVNLDCLGEPELDQLREAFRHLYCLNDYPEDRRSYNNQALIHQNHCQHGWERFLTWHRAYLYEFEQNIQDFYPNLTLPYWDWTMPQYRPEQPEKGWIIPKSFQAFLTVEAVEALLPKLTPKATPEQEKRFFALAGPRQYFVSQSAFFQHVYNDVGYTHVTPKPGDPNRRHMIDALLDSNALWYPLRYPAEYQNGGTIKQVIHYHYPSAQDIREILALNNFRDFGGGNIYDAAFGFLDQNPHNTLHIWTGGQNPYADGESSYKAGNAASTGTTVSANRLAERRNLMVRAGGRRFHSRSDLYEQPALGDMFSNLTASYDPVFWPLHVNVDRLWWEWQKLNPNSNPVELDAILSPWNYTQRDTLNTARFGYEYVRNTCFIPVGLDAPVGRFLSQPIPVSERTRDFRKAEVRLHWVPQLDRSCFIRVFLNQPGADAHTDWRDNPHFAGYMAIFGHGACYGGPGHCAAPPPRARDYDHRTPSHNMPRNHRIDVTECARHLLETADSLQITLLVIGGDYEEDIDLLKLEGVSLNFLD
ncbi:tyrosinase family protein [Methylococcus capsulatus]|uniref:Tyrosinase n=1 Tax=Methylococcus capsulatus TaxID=414 RepID=A0AA35V075_METCP|nr:tyrosinase family protein [Methylococcus capsulatus]QXP89606.1 tyrosinase family protein [Methylococcus capsulatus]CAI8817487.1 tyrosinase [Methylococcus capsulatus]